MDKQIAEYIHYPTCWDTMAYPSLASALWEMVEYPISCPTCNKSMGFDNKIQEHIHNGIKSQIKESVKEPKTEVEEC